ncbi:MAG: hypothetical protein AAF892_17270 [Cyanobacteria bacterium P01_D01_bin.71]
MLKQIFVGTLFAGILVLPYAKGSPAASLQAGQTIAIRSDNGSPPVKDGEPPLEFGESFALSPGESFRVGGGSSFFTFADFPEEVEQLEFLVEVNPGDSYLNLSLPGGVNLTTDEAETITAMIGEGEAMSIAYGYDTANDIFAFTRFTLMRAPETASTTAVPEPSLIIATGVSLLVGGMKKSARAK